MSHQLDEGTWSMVDDLLVTHPLTQKVADVILRHLIDAYVAHACPHYIASDHAIHTQGDAGVPEPYTCPYDNLPPHVQEFLHAIEGICIQYKLSVSPAEDGVLEVWDWKAGEDVLYFSGFEDRTSLRGTHESDV